MAGSVNITSKGIQKVLKHFSPKQAVAEYVWNGFDAGADTIHLQYSYDELGNMDHLSVADNGKGINLNHIRSKFNPFYDSEKAKHPTTPKHTSVMHGKNGVGRLTFFTFAYTAQWKTVFEQDGQSFAGNIRISTQGLNSYESNSEAATAGATTGTEVSFQHIRLSKEAMEAEIIPFLLSEFCWFLELHKDKSYKIFINGIPLDYLPNIEDAEDELEIYYEKTETLFRVKFIQWKQPLHKELSKYYFLNDRKEEVYKDYTTLNKKCDEFYHSVYIQSNFFNDFDFKSTEDQLQADIFGKAKSSPEYKYLIKTINEYLRNKRKPYLKVYANRLMDMYEEEAVLPLFKPGEETKKLRLQKVLMSLYESQPRLFSNLNLEQKRMVVRMIALMLDSNKKAGLMSLLEAVTDLEPDEHKELANLIYDHGNDAAVPFEQY